MGSVLEKDCGGKKLDLRITSDFPWDGKVTAEVNAEAPTACRIAFRIPGWCRDYTINGKKGLREGESVTENGETRTVKDGYLIIDRVWEGGEKLELEFPMEVRLMQADGRVREDIGKAAVMRGPVVYCMEEADNGKNLHLCSLAADPAPEAKAEEKLGQRMVTVTTKGKRLVMQPEEAGELYQEYSRPEYEEVQLQWIPYFAWANRGEGEMQVFIKAE